LDVIAPGRALVAIHSFPYSLSNLTHLIDVRSADGLVFRLVTRRYAIFGSYDRGEKACREFKTLELLQKHQIPVPQPLYLDEQGELLGTPGIVTAYVSGQQIESPPDPLAWARTLAMMLVRIHSIPCDAEARSYLLDANSEAAWFLRSGSVPDFMNVAPNGAAVWQAAHDLFPNLVQEEPALVHVDYWPGNVLWDRDRITAVLDWEEAAYGDPGIDVAYCRMHMFLSGMGQAAEEFLSAYRASSGRQVANLGFWELAAAARPMFAPEVWAIGESPKAERFRQFIRGAESRAGC
jgi:aminoglycoside phosphotransferase (APT) family kinase protein